MKLGFQVPLAIFKSCLPLVPCCADVSSSPCDFTLKQGFLRQGVPEQQQSLSGEPWGVFLDMGWEKRLGQLINQLYLLRTYAVGLELCQVHLIGSRFSKKLKGNYS